MPKKSAASIVAAILAVSFLVYSSVATLLTQSIILSSAGIIVHISSSTIAVQVGASYDDAGAYFDSNLGFHIPWSLNASQISVGHFSLDDRYYSGGLRFRDVNIPQGAKIVSTVLKCCSDITCRGVHARWYVYGENTANANEFSTLPEFEARPKTIASVDTGFFGWWMEGEWYDIPNLEGIIQEIVDRPDWRSGNALALLLYGHPDAGTTHEIRSYDANPNQAAILEVIYEVAG